MICIQLHFEILWPKSQDLDIDRDTILSDANKMKTYVLFLQTDIYYTKIK